MNVVQQLTPAKSGSGERTRRSTGTLTGWMTWTSMPARRKARASQNPEYPDS